MLPRWLVIALAILISVMWSANVIIGYLYPGHSEPSLNAIFAIVAGAVFALERVGKSTAVRNRRQRLARMLEPKPDNDDSDDRGGQP